MAKKSGFSMGRLVVVAIILLVAAAAVWMYGIWKHPLATHVKKARRTLETLGLEKMETEIAGNRLVYFQGGEGRLLVLLHGAGDQAGTWATVAGTLLEEYRLIIPDMPGHGDSEPSEGPLDFRDVVSGLETFLEMQEGDNQPILVGNSMGAWLSVLYAHRHPDDVSRVVAINGGPISGDPNNPSLTPADREAARELMDMLRDPASPKTPDFVLDDIVRRTHSGPIGRLLQLPNSFVEFLMDWRLSEVSTPVELVWGESDQFMSLAYAERLLNGLPRARLTKVTACGHIPQAECPDRFVETLLSVLRSDPPPPAAVEVEPEIEPDPDPMETADASR